MVEGFPVYLRESMIPWLLRFMKSSYGYVEQDFMLAFQTRIRRDYGFNASGTISVEDMRSALRSLDDNSFTNLVSFALYDPGYRQVVEDAEFMLSEGGSEWMAMWSDPHGLLVKRVPEGVLSAVKPVLSASDAASRKLQEAWGDAFGVNPRPSVAYGNAVVAVETAALSVIKISKQDPTLADLFSILEAEKPKWGLVLRDSDKAPGAKTLAAMLRTIWRGHESRHGRPDYKDASIEEARAAVLLAATLVDWFTTGVVRPVGGK